MLEANSDPDLNMMQRCIALAESAGSEGEYPFAAVIGAVRNAVGIRCGAFSGNMKVSFQAARSIG
jgi:tRNA(Arg) A34 adenosine deaminase TadA